MHLWQGRRVCDAGTQDRLTEGANRLLCGPIDFEKQALLA